MPAYDIRFVRELERRVADVDTASNRLDSFRQFAAIEKELEPIEECVSGLVDEIDRVIEAEIDRRRGK